MMAMIQDPVRRRRSLVPATVLVAGARDDRAPRVYAQEQSAIYLLAVDQKGTPLLDLKMSDIAIKEDVGPSTIVSVAPLRLAAQSHGARRQRPAHQRGARALPHGTEEVLRGPASGHPGVAHRHGTQPALAVPRDEGQAADRERRQPHHDRRGAGALQRCARRVCRAPGRGVPARSRRRTCRRTCRSSSRSPRRTRTAATSGAIPT